MRLMGFLGAAAFAVAACGGATDPLNGGGSGGSSVGGTVGGTPVTTTDTVGMVGIESATGPSVAYAGIAITNVPGTCAVLQRHGDPPNASVLSMIVTEPGTSVAPGTYTVTSASSGNVQASYGKSNATCQETINESASGGTITLTTVTGQMITGSFDLKFSNGDHLTGSFNAPVCNVNIFGNTTPSTCGG